MSVYQGTVRSCPVRVVEVAEYGNYEWINQFFVSCMDCRATLGIKGVPHRCPARPAKEAA
jgi:hypothetical protein